MFVSERRGVRSAVAIARLSVIPLTLLLALGLSGVARAQGERLVPEIPTFGPPKVEIEKPQGESLAGIEVQRRAAPDAAKAAVPTKVAYAIESIVLGRGFRISRKRGCVAKKVLEDFTLEQIPGPTGPFQTCLRLTASAGVVASIEARIVGPGGIEVADASGEVSFARGGLKIDFVIEWSGFTARAPGTHRMEIVLASGARKTLDFELK